VYREFAPPPEIASAVRCGWQGRAGWARSLRVLPDGCADLVWNGHELAIVTTAGAPLRLWLPDSAGTAGLRLRCGAAGSLLGQAMSELPAGVTPLSALWGGSALRAEEKLAGCGTSEAAGSVLASVVADRLRQGFEPDRVVLAAVRGLRSGSGAGGVAARLGISERGLRRHLGHEVGFGPKQVQRVLRFQRFVRRAVALSAGRMSLAGVAAELGYADQSHLGRECLRLSGSSPGALLGSWARQDDVAEKFQTR
jgi:AraC-like DNA-binding protein